MFQVKINSIQKHLRYCQKTKLSLKTPAKNINVIFIYIWSAFLVTIRFIYYTRCIFQMHGLVSHALCVFLLVSSKCKVPQNTRDVCTAANNSQSRFNLRSSTMISPYYHRTEWSTDVVRRNTAALNSSFNSIFILFTHLYLVVLVLLL